MPSVWGSPSLNTRRYLRSDCTWHARAQHRVSETAAANATQVRRLVCGGALQGEKDPRVACGASTVVVPLAGRRRHPMAAARRENAPRTARAVSTTSELSAVKPPTSAAGTRWAPATRTARGLRVRPCSEPCKARAVKCEPLDSARGPAPRRADTTTGAAQRGRARLPVLRLLLAQVLTLHGRLGFCAAVHDGHAAGSCTVRPSARDEAATQREESVAVCPLLPGSELRCRRGRCCPTSGPRSRNVTCCRRYSLLFA